MSEPHKKNAPRFSVDRFAGSFGGAAEGDEGWPPLIRFLATCGAGKGLGRGCEWKA